MSLLIILLLFSFQGTLERFTPSKLNNNYYMFIMRRHDVPSEKRQELSSSNSYQLANFLLRLAISQHRFAKLIVFPLSHTKPSSLYVDEQSLSPFDYPWKGGDPAAPSDTATLLRLHPNHWSHLRRLAPKRLPHRLRVLPTLVV